MNPHEQKKIEDLIEKALEKRKKNQGFIFRLHPKIEVHLLILLLINMISGVVAIAFGHLFKIDLIEYTLLSLVVFIVLSTIVEFIVKVIVYQYIHMVNVFMVGIPSYIIQCLLFYGVSSVTKAFNFIGLKSLLIFTLIFMIFRIILTLIIRRYTFRLRG